MSIVIRMPQLAAGGADAAIQTWLVAPGDSVAVGQAIVEIETEKAVVEHEAEAAGTVAAILVAEGVAAPVGAPIAVLAEAGESNEQAISNSGVSAEAPAPTAVAPVAPVAPAEPPAPAPAPVAPATVAPVAASADADSAPGSRLFASPLVRRLAREHNVDLASVPGSGPRGRIVRRDLDAVLAAGVAAPAPAPAPVSEAGYVDTPHTGMRRAIARRLVESKTTIPHFTLTAECRVDELLAVRARVNESLPSKVSVNDFVVKAVAAAFAEVPEANVIWTDDATRQFSAVDVAIAVSIPGGLITPVVRGVDTLSLSALSTTISDLAQRGRDGKLKQHELEGGSFSVSNLGMFGTAQFSAIINPPHSGILAVGAAQKRPVVAEDGSLTVATVMTVTLSADHRVLDGALAAQWLSAFVRRIENPLTILI